MTNLIPYVGAWAVLVVAVLALALYRKHMSAHEEDRYVHISEGEARLIPHQIAVNRSISKIDRYGEMLTVVALVSGLALATVYLYLSL